MQKYSITVILACVVSGCLFLQGANAQDCPTPKTQACVTNFATTAGAAGQDKTKLRSAANSYLNCVNKVVTDCNLDPNIRSAINLVIAAVNKQSSQAGCGNGAIESVYKIVTGNGASGSVYSIVTIVVGVCLHKLF